MAAASNAASVVVDHTGIDLLVGLAAEFERVVCVFQPSPDRLTEIRRRFRGADVVVATPTLDGPWQTWVDEDLEALRSADVDVCGVPVLDCFRAAIRDDLSILRAIEWGLGGRRNVSVAMRHPAASMLAEVRDGGGLDQVTACGEGRQGRPGIISKIRRAGARGLSMAITSRLDPTGSRRAKFRRRLHVAATPTLLVSSYVNPTRAALEAHDALGGGPAILVETGPGASRGLRLPPEIRRVSIPTAITIDPTGVAALRATAVPRALEAITRWKGPKDRWPAGAALLQTSLGVALARILLPEVASAIAALSALIRTTGAKRIIVGDEFSFVDRAALHLGRALGLETISRQHGVLDSHYLRNRVLADRHLAWDAATVAWLERRGALSNRPAEILPRRLPALAPRLASAQYVVVFLQPFQMIGIAPRDWLGETIPVVVRAASTAGLETILKPHPLQSASEIRDNLPESVRSECRVVTDRSARDLLQDAAIAVTLDSSVAVDCREAGVTCISTAWYAGTYRAELESLGYVESVASPRELFSELSRRLAAAGCR